MDKKEKKYRQQILGLLQNNLEMIFKNRKKDFNFFHNEIEASSFELQVCKNDKKCKFIFDDFCYRKAGYRPKSSVARFVGISFQIGRRTAPSSWKLFLRHQDDVVVRFIQNDELLELIEYFLTEYDGTEFKKNIFLTKRENIKSLFVE